MCQLRCVHNHQRGVLDHYMDTVLPGPLTCALVINYRTLTASLVVVMFPVTDVVYRIYAVVVKDSNFYCQRVSGLTFFSSCWYKDFVVIEYLLCG